MTEILEPGSGKSSLYGGTPIIVIDPNDHWLYGWTQYEIAKAHDHKLCVVRGVNLDLFLAYIGARFPEAYHLTKPLFNTSTIRYEDLLAINQAVTLTMRHATELEEMSRRYEDGKFTDRDGNPIRPTRYTAT